MYDAIAEALAFLEGYTLGNENATHQLGIVRGYIEELHEEINEWEEGKYVNLYDV